VPTELYETPRGSAELSKGTLLGKYEIVRPLGAGGMGAVYEAVHTQIGKRVAIKVLAPAVAAKPEARSRFLREAQLTSKVRHPHAVDVTDMGTEGEQTFLVMELLDGEDLAARLVREQRLAIADLCDILLPVCSAVAAAHAAAVIHRDLKPQNIFLARGANGLVAKVLDFGISKAQDATTVDALTGSDAVIGTPYYLAPEQVTDGRNASPASDQYAIGVVLYECLTGERPYQADSLYGVFHAIITGQPTRPRDRRPDIDVQFEAIVLRAMNVSPEWRFPSVTALAQALWPFASDRGRMLWREAFGPAPSQSQPAQPASSSNETAVDDAVRTPRWPGRDAPAAKTPEAATPPPPAATTAPAPRGRGPFRIVALVTLALGAGALWVATGKLRRHGESVEPRTVAPAPTPAAVATPAPAAAAPPAPAPSPPAAPAPAPAVTSPHSPPVAEPARARPHTHHTAHRKETAPAPGAPAPRGGPNNAPLIE
jgi:serine/threonine-protein kinase